jgi:acyl dehydratase
LATSTGEAARDFGPALRAIPVGHTESARKTVGETDVYLFAGITGDFSGVHVDEEFSKSTRTAGASPTARSSSALCPR